MNLYIVRHGEAKREDEDPQRGLSDRGKTEVEKVAQVLKKKGATVSMIYHSGKKRAKQTAQIIAKLVSPGCTLIQKEQLAPNDDIKPTLKEIKRFKSGDLMIVGHLPFVAKLACACMTGQEEGENIPFRAGAVAVLEQKDDGYFELEEVVSPANI